NGAVLGVVVDHVDAVDEPRNRSESVPDQGFLVVRRDDDGDALAIQHRLTGGGESAARGLPEDRRQQAEGQADESAGEPRAADATRGRLPRRRTLDDARLLDVLRQRERLLSLQEVRLDDSAPLLAEADRRVERRDEQESLAHA